MDAPHHIGAGPFATTGRSRHGEPWVWLTAAGLTLGVLMALGLFVLILVKGAASFWPRSVERIEVLRNGTTTVIAGIITQENERRATDGTLHEQIQIFRGNRDLSGEAFVYLDRKDITATARPESMLVLERLEYGPAIVEAVALETGGTRVAAGDPAFASELERLLDEGRTLRKQLLRVERRDIGAVSRELEALDRTQRAGTIATREAATGRAALEARFEKLREEALRIRSQLRTATFVGIAADGRELRMATGDLLDVFAPNQAGWTGRLGEALRRVWKFLVENPREANTEGGVFPAIFGTVVMTLVMSLFVTPFGVIAAIYLREYARQGLLVRIVRVCVNNLAGVPSIVFGVFGLAFFVYFVGGFVDRSLFADRLPTPTFGTPGILWASLTLALLTLPVLIVATEEALGAVPRGVREAALACGASKWQMIQRVVLPASLPGILTGIILAMARGAGEVAPLMLVGVVKLAPSLPVDTIAPFIHPERKFMHLGFHIYDLGFQSPDAEAAKPMVFATALLLILVVVILNLAAILIRNRIRRRFATSSF